MKHKLALLVVFVVTLVIPTLLFAQDAATTPIVHAGDTFPAAMGYAAIALAGTVWATMGTVIGHLWKKVGALIETHKLEFGSLIERHKLETDALHESNAKVQAEWRVESERLLREQRDIFREAMTTNGAVSTALTDLSNMIQRLDAKWSGEDV